MIITKKHLSRRTFLRGTFGTMVALPMLDAMVPALTAQSRTAANAPFRFGAMYLPNGIQPAFWHPDAVGSDFEFKQVMKPLEPFRDQVVTISKMKAPDGSVHLGASAAFLNGTGPAGGREGTGGGGFGNIQSKKTVDQWIADKVAEDTPLRSIEIGTEDMGTAAGACDGFPCTFFNTLAWRDDTSPLPVGINPRVTFERMFGESGNTEQRLASLRRKQSMLDSVVEETARLRRNLGPADNAILDNYLTNVRQVEQQLERMEARQASLVDTSDAPIGIPDVFDEHMTISYNLMHLAYQADISRVFTFLLGHEASTRSYAHIGVPEAHHSISHHANDPEKLEKYAKIGLYHVLKIAEFAEKLKATPDGDGNLLDHTVIYFGSGMSNGNQHDRNNPPAVLVGGGNGRLQGNRHISVDNKEPTANLLLALAHLANVEIESLGPSTGRLDL
ncbi:MAG: DUF1552 domain-containing protein [Acidobacteria bacterium]|nr:DUF1552 domain-containing protein [Acidobacteriota bacterium]